MASEIILSFLVGLLLGFFLGLGWTCEVIDDIKREPTKRDSPQQGRRSQD